MNSLINLYENKERMKIIIDYKEYYIKIQGTTDEPYFCGKDVCEILGYTDIEQALRKHVDKDYKLSLIEVPVISTGTSNSLIKLGIDITNISYNDGKAIYISEPGLYSLIMHSKKEFAKKFQKLVYEEILPSIRKYGQFTLLKKLEEIEEKQKQLEQEKLILQQESNKKDKEIEQRKIENELHIKNMATKEKNGYIYIATTDIYASKNQFKIGRTDNLVKRLPPYQTGRTDDDDFYYVFIFECYKIVSTRYLKKWPLGSGIKIQIL